MDSSNKQFKKELLLLKEKNYAQLSQVDKISISLVVISLYYCVIYNDLKSTQKKF